MGKIFEALNKSTTPGGRRPDEIRPPAEGQMPDVPDSPAPTGKSGGASWQTAEQAAAAEPTRSIPDSGAAVAPSFPATSQEGGSRDEFFERPPVSFNGNFHEKLVAVNAASSPVAESFRRLRSKILHPADGKVPKAILVTSSVKEEGKGFVSANLGVTMAMSMQQHALLVDCDLRRPSLSGWFGVSNEPGLVEHLQKGTELAGLISKTGIPKLSLIPSGPPPINPSELLSSDQMFGLIEELRSRYADRFVILDTPPMQVASETAVLAQHVDGVIVVVRWGLAGREKIKQLVEMIGRQKILGVVFNAYQVNDLASRLHDRYSGYYDHYSGSYN